MSWTPLFRGSNPPYYFSKFGDEIGEVIFSFALICLLVCLSVSPDVFIRVYLIACLFVRPGMKLER